MRKKASVIQPTPQIPKFVQNKFGVIMSDVNLDQRFDGWSNILSGIGTGNDKKMSGQVSYRRLSEVEVETLYAQDDMAARIVDLLPEHALRKWVAFEGLDDDVEKEFIDLIARLRVKSTASMLLKWARLYGGGGALIGTPEMGDLEEPLDLDDIDNIVSFVILNRWELFPEDIQYDTNQPNVGLPETYQLAIRGETPINAMLAHHSRIIRADGVILPRRLSIQNNYWGDSVLTRVWEIIRDFSAAHSAVATVMQDFRVGVFKMSGLAEKVAMGMDGEIQKRMSLVDASKSVARSVVIDAENEEFSQQTGSLSGVKDLVECVNDRLVAATGIPITILLGRSPVGLGGSGSHELTNWYDSVAAYQEDVVRPVLKKFFETILLTKDSPTGGEIPDGFGFTFVPLAQLDESAQTTNRYTQAQADAIYMSAGAVTPEEIALSRFGSGKYDPTTIIDTDLRDQLTAGGPTDNTPTDPNDPNDPKNQAALQIAAKSVKTPADMLRLKASGVQMNEFGQPLAGSGAEATEEEESSRDDAAIQMIIVSRADAHTRRAAIRIAKAAMGGKDPGKPKETSTGFRFTVKDRSDFEPDSLAQVRLDEAVTVIKGKLK